MWRRPYALPSPPPALLLLFLLVECPHPARQWLLGCRLPRRHPLQAAANRNRCAGGGTLLTDAQVLRHSTARRDLVAVVADGRQGGDPCLLGSTAVPEREWVAALGTPASAADTGVKAAPAVDAVAVTLKALVHLARGQLEAHWARQIECHLRHRLDILLLGFVLAVAGHEVENKLAERIGHREANRVLTKRLGYRRSTPFCSHQRVFAVCPLRAALWGVENGSRGVAGRWVGGSALSKPSIGSIRYMPRAQLGGARGRGTRVPTQHLCQQDRR